MMKFVSDQLIDKYSKFTIPLFKKAANRRFFVSKHRILTARWFNIYLVHI